MLVSASDWTNANNFGLLHLLNSSTLLSIIVGILLLDLVGGMCGKEAKRVCIAPSVHEDSASAA
jgi:hypothetical protein